MSDSDLAKLSLMKLNKEPYIIYVENISQLYEIQDNKTLPTKIANEQVCVVLDQCMMNILDLIISEKQENA